MKIIIEEHHYRAADVKEVLRGIDALENVDGYVSVNYVGYYFNTQLDRPDCVFILPKVLLEDVDGKGELVFGRYRPEDIIDLDAENRRQTESNEGSFNCRGAKEEDHKVNPLTQQEKDFIYEFSVWIYRAITVFHNDKRNKTGIVYHK